MSVSDDLDVLFPGHGSPNNSPAWDAVKNSHALGEVVRGVVKLRYPFGVFIDISVGFPALLLVVRFRNADERPYTNIDDYPIIGTEIEARICVWDGSSRQIGLSQLERESMLGET